MHCLIFLLDVKVINLRIYPLLKPRYLKPIEWLIVRIAIIQVEQVYQVVIQIQRLEHSLAHEQTLVVDVAILTHAYIWPRMLFIERFTNFVELRRVEWRCLLDLSTLIKFAVFVHHDLIHDLVSDHVLDFGCLSHLQGTALLELKIVSWHFTRLIVDYAQLGASIYGRFFEALENDTLPLSTRWRLAVSLQALLSPLR